MGQMGTKWVKTVQKYRVWSRPKKNESRWKRTVICSKHFEKSCFREGGKRPRIKPGPIPTLFMTPRSQSGNISSVRTIMDSIIKDYQVSTDLYTDCICVKWYVKYKYVFTLADCSNKVHDGWRCSMS